MSEYNVFGVVVLDNLRRCDILCLFNSNLLVLMCSFNLTANQYDLFTAGGVICDKGNYRIYYSTELLA
jgi:hypothetical protein